MQLADRADQSTGRVRQFLFAKASLLPTWLPLSTLQIATDKGGSSLVQGINMSLTAGANIPTSAPSPPPPTPSSPSHTNQAVKLWY